MSLVGERFRLVLRFAIGVLHGHLPGCRIWIRNASRLMAAIVRYFGWVATTSSRTKPSGEYGFPDAVI